MDPSKPPSPPPPDSSWQDEGIEFELTDLDSARAVLDNESISQFDVASASTPAHWKRVRRATLPSDRALTGKGIDWLLSLPTSLRPQVMSVQFPRIVNALADVWDDPAQCQAALDKLLSDGRKGRQGFPPKVHDELVALRNWTDVF